MVRSLLAQRDIRCTEEEGYLILPVLSNEIAAQLTRFLAESRLRVVPAGGAAEEPG